jgi:hypothetical protein
VPAFLAHCWSWLRRRPGAAAALLYALLALAFYAPGLVPGHTLSASDYLWSAAPWSSSRPADVRAFGSNFELVDTATVLQPFLRHTRERLPDAPLWNPYVGGGRPFLGNLQSAVLSPFSLPAYVLPFGWSLGLAAALKVFVAAFGTYLLGRALAMSFAGALLAGIIYGFNLFLIVWVPWPVVDVWAWLPWLLLLADRVARDPSPLSTAGLAVVVAVQFFGGHPESSFHLLVVAVAFFALRLVLLRRDGNGPRAGPAVLALGAGLAGGAALAAITLVPFLELLRHSGDVTVRQDYWRLRLPREYLLGFALPDYWGRGTSTEIGEFAQSRAVYVGALPLVLAGAALVVRPSALRVAVAALGAVLLAIILGVQPLPEIIRELPIVRTGNHLRLIVIVALCLALLAGWGLDELARERPPRRATVLTLAGALLVLPVLVVVARGHLSADALGRALKVASRVADPPEVAADPRTRAIIHMAALIAGLAFLGAAAALVALRLGGRLAAGAFVPLATGLVVVDVFYAGMGQTPAIATSTATQPATPALRRLQAARPNRFVGLERALGPSPIPPNIAMRERLQDARSYDFPVERRYDRLWRRTIGPGGGPGDFPTTKAVLTPASLPALRLLSVTDIVQDPAERRIAAPALPVTYDRPDARIYANPGALPRAGVVNAQHIVEGDDAELEAVLRPGFDGRRVVVTQRPLPGLGDARGRGPAGSARIVRHEPERVVVEAIARRPSELVLTDLHFPGWKATLDGRAADVHRVDWMLRGTSLPPGRHTVEFRYEPVSWRIGRLVSLLTVLVLASIVAVTVRQPRCAADHLGQRPRRAERR